MKLAASTELGNMTETVRSFSESMYNIMTKKFEYLGERIKQLIQSMSTSVDSIFDTMLSGLSESVRNATNNIVRSFSNLSNRISSNMGNGMYNAGRSAASLYQTEFLLSTFRCHILMWIPIHGSMEADIHTE